MIGPLARGGRRCRSRHPEIGPGEACGGMISQGVEEPGVKGPIPPHPRLDFVHTKVFVVFHSVGIRRSRATMQADSAPKRSARATAEAQRSDPPAPAFRRHGRHMPGRHDFLHAAGWSWMARPRAP